MYFEFKTGYTPAHHYLISGNEFLSMILAQGQYELKVELEDFSGETRYARYTTFNIGDQTSNFKLTVDGYSGDAGTSTTVYYFFMFCCCLHYFVL